MRRPAALFVALALLLFTGCGQAERAPEERGEERPARQETGAATTGTTRETTSADAADASNAADAADEPETTVAEAKDATNGPETAPGGAGGGETTEATAGVGGTASDGVSADGAPFTAEPAARGGEPGAAETIAEVRYGAHEGYERLVVEFGAGGGPADGVPEWSFESPTGDGFGRVTFPGLGSTAASGGNPDGSILDDFYVVRAPGGGFFVDLFATGAFQYRILELRDPGRLAIDYRPAAVELDYPLPVRGERNVVVEPRSGEVAESPLTISGYSRNFEAQTTIVLRGPNGETLARESVRANDWAGTWGYFEAALEFPAFDGEATLLVGAESARDGSFEGVEVPVSGAGTGG